MREIVGGPADRVAHAGDNETDDEHPHRQRIRAAGRVHELGCKQAEPQEDEPGRRGRRPHEQ